MCTSISIDSKDGEIFFGRTMDFSYELDPEVYIFPRNYKWKSLVEDNIFITKYKFIGTGQNIGGVTLADGVNENGLAVAALYFYGFAHYNSIPNHEKTNIASIELANFLLGECRDIEEVMYIINKIEIIGVTDPITNTVTPLHWIVVDRKGKCIVIEQTIKGLEIFNNQAKTLANSPNFDWHMTNLRNYMNVSPNQTEEANWDNIKLKPFGQAGGSFGLPGDYTSPSRFVRTTFLRSFSDINDTSEDVLNTCFNIMKSVSIPKGIVLTSKGTYDYTQYTVFMNIFTGDYYFNTYNNNQIFHASINDSNSLDVTSLGGLKQKFKAEHI